MLAVGRRSLLLVPLPSNHSHESLAFSSHSLSSGGSRTSCTPLPSLLHTVDDQAPANKVTFSLTAGVSPQLGPTACTEEANESTNHSQQVPCYLNIYIQMNAQLAVGSQWSHFAKVFPCKSILSTLLLDAWSFSECWESGLLGSWTLVVDPFFGAHCHFCPTTGRCALLSDTTCHRRLPSD